MNNLLDSTSGLLQSNYRALGQQALNHRQNAVQQLISQRQLPPQGWNDGYIQAILGEIAMMDSNNFVDTVGVGEREGRVFSSLVRQRHMSLSHGMGRSGDLVAQQPKAAGSSLLLTLTHALTLHAIKLAGLTEAKQVLLLPVATGMSIVLTLTAIMQHHPKYKQNQKSALKFADEMLNAPSVGDDSISLPLSPPSVPTPLYVIWSRIDQKTCLKSIFAAGLIPVVIELKQVADQLVTDLEAIERAIERLGVENILAVVSTTSCFAPRVPDRVIEISQLCHRHHIAHVVNNAYGLQSSSTCALINAAVRKRGRIDAVISSMDKNFLVPVGGAIVIGFNKAEKPQPNNKPATTTTSAPSNAPSSSLSSASSVASHSPPSSLPNVLNLISSLYPGRASSSAVTDLFITLLSMGADGWKRLLTRREELMPKFKTRLAQLAEQYGERILQTDENTISFGMTLDRITQHLDDNLPASTDGASTSIPSSSSSSAIHSKFVPSYLGSLLFSRNVSGPRVLSQQSPPSTINGITFQRYGTHSSSYPHSYLTAACGIGMEEREVELFVQRLENCIKEFHKQRDKEKKKFQSKGGEEKSTAQSPESTQ